ncbi:exosortase-associated EpsI family protein [Undibacterium sp.]|jgi:exosortase|uniref:exosortase-associated EpsI family protein n=1 Tax=Undibacterium sp. TaxID=1914977 RepID=UPI002C487A8D|nr:exosortase-associated EpsI family protein [Undibacterium sp.]HTD06344.1 exosortase-associated EpsI family protein [Undibacterium sp.]
MADEFNTLYQIVFLSTVGLLVLLERVQAFQRESIQIAGRWTTNIGLLLIGSVITSLLIPVGIYGFAQAQAPGLLARLGVPATVQILLTLLFLDLWRYWEHRLYHRLPLLWRLHLVHHSDTQIDVTTTERHHPLESILGTAVMMALILALGLPAAGIGLYILAATVVSFYSHANLRLPETLDRLLRQVIVTPPVHAVHHSDLRTETDSNYGTVLTLWDRLFGSYVDPAEASIPHFGLEYFHRAPDTGLGRALQQPFLFRNGMAYPARERSPGGAGGPAAGTPYRLSPALARNWKIALLGGISGCVLASLVLWPTLSGLAALWTNNEAYQYAWLVAPMMVYLLAWDQRRATLAINPQPDFSGVLVAIGAAALWCIAALMNIDVGRQVALVLAVQGIAMAMLGWRPYWRLFPVVALLFLMIPSGDLLQPLLRIATVKAIELFAVVAQLPHKVEGFVVYIGTHRYIVVDECSGLSYVSLAIFLSYSFALLLYRSIFKVVALSLFGALLGMLSNALRVNAIILIDWVRGSQMALTAHGGIQWMALFVTLGLLFFVLSRLKADTPDTAPVAASPEPTNIARQFAPVAAGLAVLLIIGGLLSLPINAQRTPHAATTAAAPQNIAGWQLASPAADWIADPQNQSESLSLTYQRNGREMRVLMVETLSPTAKLTESRLAPGDKEIWREGQIQKQSACVDSHCLSMLHSTWQRDKSESQRHVFYRYGIGGFTTDSKLSLRAMQGWDRLTGDGHNPRLIACIFDDAAPATEDVAAVFLTLQSAVDAGSL